MILFIFKRISCDLGSRSQNRTFLDSILQSIWTYTVFKVYSKRCEIVRKITNGHYAKQRINVWINVHALDLLPLIMFSVSVYLACLYLFSPGTVLLIFFDLLFGYWNLLTLQCK